MSKVFVCGLGAVSPAGWNVAAFQKTLAKNEPLPLTPLIRPGWERPLWVRPVPPPDATQPFLAHPRLRRANALTQQAVAAALEALGNDVTAVQTGVLRLRILVCLMPGCVTYSRRFFEEVLRDPATASPLFFPETVYNAPASHLAAFLNSAHTSYTLVGDESCYLHGLALAANWLLEGQADGCLVVAAEEMDWIVADAVRLFSRRAVPTAGAAAIYLRGPGSSVPVAQLACITDAFPFNSTSSSKAAALSVRAQLPLLAPDELLCPGTRGLPRLDAGELGAWRDWAGRRIEPNRIFGEAFTVSSAWQCVAACASLDRGEFRGANVSVIGTTQRAIGARFVSTAPKNFA